MGQPLAPRLDTVPTPKRARPSTDENDAPSAYVVGVNAAVLHDIAAFYESSPTRTGRLDLMRTRRDRPPHLQMRCAVLPALFEEEDDEDDEGRGSAGGITRGTGSEESGVQTAWSRRTQSAGDLSVVYQSQDGVCWELGCWKDVRDSLSVFQLVLDVLTATVGTFRISSLRVRDSLHRVPCIRDGLRVLRNLGVGGTGHGDSSFVHPITADRIEILLPPPRGVGNPGGM